MFAPGLSILLIATIIGTLAALQWFIASLVCGIIPSSAATTNITISVTWAPLALIAVNASCPGVSKNVIFSPFNDTVYAPICWVIPPASLAVTFACLIASKSEVLPWSTCPIIVTIGGLLTKFSSTTSVSSSKASNSTSFSFFSTKTSYFSQSFSAVAKSISWFTPAITPKNIKFLITSFAGLPSFSHNSLTVIVSPISITPHAASAFCSTCSFSNSFLFFFFLFTPLLSDSDNSSSYSSTRLFFPSDSLDVSPNNSFISVASSSSITLIWFFTSTPNSSINKFIKFFELTFNSFANSYTLIFDNKITPG